MRALVAAALGAVLASPLAAQEDYRGLDAGRPLRVMDAYPLSRFEWEVQAGLAGRLGEDLRGLAGSFALEAGLFRNFALGVEIEPALERVAGRSSGGIEELGAHVLYSLNQEGWSWPALALEVSAAAPVGGDLGRDRWGASGTLIATRSLASGTRVHANVGYAVADSRDGGEAWQAGVAADIPVRLGGRLLAGDIFAEFPAHGGRTRVWTGLGARMQANNRDVLDFGIATRLDRLVAGEFHVELVVGISRSFGILAFTPTPPYPDPAIR